MWRSKHTGFARTILYKVLLFSLLLCGGGKELCAQFYPIHAVVQWPSPQSPHLVDYYSGSRDRLIITLHNRDLQQPLLLARLRLQIKSNGFLAQTREELSYPQLELMAGVPTRLTATDLMPYLRPESLLINGRLRNGQFPTGFTEISVQVVDYYSQQVLSSWHTARAYLDSKQPPMLNLPQRDEQVAYRDPLFIRFQWYPRHQGLAGTEYEFVLKELPDNGAAPQAAFAYGNEIYRTRTRHTTLNYTHLEPILLPNRRYAWQVQAIARDGVDELGLFEHGGFSEIYWFTLNENCPVPTGLKADPRYAKVDFSWNRVVGATGYMLACRPKTSKDIYEWSEVQSYGERMTLAQLKPGWTYEWRVGTLCTGDKPIYSAIQEVTLPKSNVDLLRDCGKEPPRPNLSPDPALDIQVGDTVTIGGDYPMVITQLQGLGDGWYSGRGTTRLSSIIELPRVALRFDRLRINIEKCQIDGLVEAIYADQPGGIADLDKIDDGGKRVQPSKLRIRERKVDFALGDMPEMSFDPETGELEMTDAEGKPQRIKLDLPEGGASASAFPMIITDSKGDSYQLSPDESSEVSSSGASSSTSSTEGRVGTKQGIKVERVERIGSFDASRLAHSIGTVRFEPSAQARYAFDSGTEPWYQRSVKLDEYYKPFAKGYIAPWKLIPVGEQDVVAARYEGKKAIDLRRVRFATSPNSPALPAELHEESKTWSLKLPGTDAQSSYDVYAIYEGQVIGKLRVVSYPKQSYRVRLVSVNGQRVGDVSELSQHLNNIYQQVGVEFRLSETDSFQAELSNGHIRQDLKKLRDSYEEQHPLGRDEVCVFVLSSELSKSSKLEDVEGLMPRKSRFGYIFTGNSPNGKSLARTLAHELGHGLFTLQHSFDDEYGGKQSQNETVNLMDYTVGATKLVAFQWNIISNPAPFTALDREKDAQIREAGAIWMTPDWEPFICDVSDHILSRNKEIPHGSIGGIKYKGQIYEYSSALKTYVNAEGGQLAITKPTSGDSIYLVNRDRGECGSVYRGAWAYVRSVRNINFSDSVSLRYVGPLQCFSLPNPDRVVEGGATVMYFIGESSGYKDKVLDLLYKELANKEDRNQLTQSRFSDHVCLVVTTQGENLAGNKTFADLQKSYHNVVSIQIKIEEDGTVSLVNLFTSKPLNQYGSGLDIERIKGLIQKEPWYIQAIILYELSDLLDKGIQHLKISEDIWACTGSPSIYKKLIGYVLDIFSSLVLPNNIKLSDEAKFAFLCGFWDGIVDVVQSVPQLTKLMLCAFHSDCRDNASNQWTSFKEATIEDEQGVLICAADQYWCKAYEILAPAFKELVADDCKTAHTVGAIVGPSVAMMLGDAPAGAAVLSRLGSVGKGLWQMLQALKFCDRITDITTYLGKPLRTAIKFIRNRGTGRLGAKVTVNNTSILDVAEGQVKIKRGQTATGAPKYESLSDDQIRLVLENKDELTKIVEEVDNTTKNTLDLSTNKSPKADAKIAKGARSREIIDQLKTVGEVSKDLREAIEALDEDLLAQLHHDLVVSSRSKTLREVLTSVEDLEIWKTLKQDFHKAHSIAKDSPNWERWAKSEFFKEITDKGREFGKNVTEAIKDKRLYQRLKEALGKSDLDGYKLETEVQLFIEGDRYMVADILLFKRDKITQQISDVILIENKLSSSTRFTSKQAEMFAKVREAKRLEVKVRSRGRETIDRDEIIPLSSSQLIEIRGDGKTTGISNITINRIK
ncbi:hypothetical protein HMPREF3185_00115 [Porphyromonas somerae]|uniref:Fibronectin type III domain protein n=2 Tax=Porphyromonas somerae TaxID=322095 RepID=A0A134BF23_9PORP|nr:hypothetical protein HMPREF3184_00115 [Porphyromonadaceae bacterium KA00676]KXB78545.1 hypothetical protein HMPREF3185_00115 [Porphyromonas somerae]